jgi:hypothetical protein
VPSAALLRAVLINGAQDMSKKGGRLGSKGAHLLPAPSMEIGFGRVNLLKSLRVPNADGTGKLQCMRPEVASVCGLKLLVFEVLSFLLKSLRVPNADGKGRASLSYYVCMHVCMYVCMHTYICINLSIHPSIHLLCIYLSIDLSIFLYLSIYLYLSTYS